MLDILAKRLKIEFKEIKKITWTENVCNILLNEDVPIENIPGLTKQFHHVLIGLAQGNGNVDFQFYIKRGYGIYNYLSYNTADDYHIQVFLDDVMIELKLAKVIAENGIYNVFNENFEVIAEVIVINIDGEISRVVTAFEDFKKLQPLIAKNVIVKYLP